MLMILRFICHVKKLRDNIKRQKTQGKKLGEIMNFGRGGELLKTVNMRISFHFPPTWGVHSFFQN
ncbi:hypothetical protein EO95_03795 [Methanosarcina sp. 1.H.T.1A.1]|nr:hypothetical protein EO95_03795 [Methanosarcina sp. 1.H.T.1A.1]